MLFLLAMPAFAQSPAAPDTLPTAEVESLLKTLKDDDRRNAFVTDLEALVAAQKLRDAEVEKSLGALVLETVSCRYVVTRGTSSLTSYFSEEKMFMNTDQREI